MSTLPPSPFLNSTATQPATVASTADSACRLQNVARPDATAERDPHPISESTLDPATGVDAAAGPEFADPPVPAAEPIADPDGGYMGRRLSPALGTSVGIAATDPCQEPVAAPPIDHIHEIFFYVRKLMKQPPRFVLDEAAFMADVEEVPLFIREDGYLRRQA